MEIECHYELSSSKRASYPYLTGKHIIWGFSINNIIIKVVAGVYLYFSINYTDIRVVYGVYTFMFEEFELLKQ